MEIPDYMIATATVRARLPPVHPHMLRHSCGFALADKGYDLRRIRLSLSLRFSGQALLSSRITSAIATQGIPSTTPASRAGVSKGSGAEHWRAVMSIVVGYDYVVVGAG